VQDFGHELRRIPTSTHLGEQGQEKGPEPLEEEPGLGILPPYLRGCLITLPYRANGVMTPQVAGMVASWGSDGSSSLLPADLKS
jgi:hypothetical protein